MTDILLPDLEDLLEEVPLEKKPDHNQNTKSNINHSRKNQQ